MSANQVTFANPPTAGGPGANAGGPPNQAGGQANQAAAAVTNPPAVSNTVTWENLVNIDTLPNHSIAKGLAIQHKDAPWEDVVEPFDMAYHNDSGRVARELAVAPAPKYFLAVNDAGLVQLIFGLRYCFVMAGQGERLLALGGERTVIAGTERQPDLLSLKGMIAGQATHFASVAVRAAEGDDIIAAFDADDTKTIMDPLAEDANDPTVNPEVTARRALVIHPKLGLLFLKPQALIDVLRLARQIQAAVPAAFRAKLAPLLNFARVATTASTAGGQQSSLKADWQRINHGTDPALVTWYYELVGACAARHVPAQLSPAAGGQATNTAPTVNLDPQFGAALQQLASSNNILAERKTTTYKQHELDELFKLCQTPLLLERERSASDLPLFWVDFHKHRGKVSEARGYIERHFKAHYPQDGALESVLFGHRFVQDLMAHDLHGRDRMTEFSQRYRGVSVFSVAPLDIGGATGETQRQEFVRQESARLRLDETVALEKKNDKLMDSVVKWPTTILEFRRFMEHLHHTCEVFFGKQFKLAEHFARMAKACHQRQYFARYKTIHWWTLLWRMHMALRQFLIQQDDDLFDQAYADIKRHILPSADSLPEEMQPKTPPARYITDESSTSGSSISDLSQSTQGSNKRQKSAVQFSGAQAFAQEIAYAKGKIPDFKPGVVFPGGDLDKLLGADFRTIVNGRQPCFRHLILGACTASNCTRSHELTREPTQGMINGIKGRFRAGVDRYVTQQGDAPKDGQSKNKTWRRKDQDGASKSTDTTQAASGDGSKL